jgi:sugar (pentulose or hexulose) kinase
MQHCLIFDIGKTNKKAFVFDEDYRIVGEKTARFPEITDDDGDPCEDLVSLRAWVIETAAALRRDPDYDIKAVHATAYGASFVHLDADLEPVAPLYNYLKPFPADLQEWFLARYGGAERLSLETASPLLGHLNSGLQLLWLKHRKPHIFSQIHYSVHLPQWIAMLLSDDEPPTPVSDMTSLGCHTMLWDFQRNAYHAWVEAEGILDKLPPLAGPSNAAPGLHDSSAALIPYLASFQEPFVLISTGTWCISLNPFNDAPLTPEELALDCLCYLTREGKPVKAARYFGGYEHEAAVERITRNYGVSPDFYRDISRLTDGGNMMDFQAALDEYDHFMRNLVDKQVASTRLAIGQSAVRRIFVDGGFSGNAVYMSLLAERFPELEVCAAEVAQATALGAALAVHGVWNRGAVPGGLIAWKTVI